MQADKADPHDFAVLEIYDVVVSMKAEDWWYDEGGVPIADVTAKMEEVKGQPLLVRLNCRGGEAAAGITMYNRLLEHDAEVCTLVDGQAASAASVIFLAGERRFMAPGTTLMIHEPLTYTVGNIAAHEQSIAQLKALRDSVATLYADRTKAKLEDVKAWLAAETHFTPEQAIEHGFATELWTAPEKKADAPQMTARKPATPPAAPAASEMTFEQRKALLIRKARQASLA